jgi:hypothetical protein
MNFLLVTFICFIGTVHSFVPASVMSQVLYKLDGRFKGNLGKVSDSLTHDEIVKRGLIQSVASYMKKKTNSKIDMSKMNDYYNVQNLYFDYYGEYSNYLKSYFVTFFLILMNF